MIARKLIEIHLREGVTARLLLTPALYGVAKERGIDLYTSGTQDKTSWVVDLYAKMAYCAAISAWEVESVDDPGKGEFPFNFEDFTIWAWENPKEFGTTIDAILLALTGKRARDYVREEAAEAEAEKKKTRPRTSRSLSRWITRKSKPSSAGAAE